MKNLRKFSLLALSLIVLNSCSDDDDSTPEIINEEEVITTLRVTLTPDDGGEAVVFDTVDIDGDGPEAPVVTELVTLSAATTYNGSIEFLNESLEETEDVTEEIEEEDDEHQIFYVTNDTLDLTTEYGNFDDNDYPLGTEFTLTTGAASEGTFTVTLRHEPTKPNTGLEDAGGETEFETTYNVTIADAVVEPVM